MAEKIGLSLHDALLWKKCEVVRVSEFVFALQFWQSIDEKQALTELSELMINLLPVYDKSKQYTFDKNDERWPDYQGLIAATVLAKRNGIQLDEIEGKPIPDFKNLLIIRKEAFAIFGKLGVAEPYPWPYPLEWIGGMDEEDTAEETGEKIKNKLHGNTVLNAAIREKIAWACLAVLAKYPDECRGASGKVMATKLRDCLDRNAIKFWPDTGSPDRSAGAIEKMISKALAMIE